MIPIYDIGDFSPFYTQDQQFLIVPFEQLNRPVPFLWPHKHRFYEILWIREGEAKHFVDNDELDLTVDSIYFMSPGQAHHFEQYKEVKGDSIMFTEEFFMLHFSNQEALQKLSFLDSSYTRPTIQVDAETKNTLEPVLQLMYKEFSRKDYSKLVLTALLYVFLNAIQRTYFMQHTGNSSGNQLLLFNRFKKTVESYYKQQQPLTFYASELCVTPHYLNEVVKKVSGKTAGEMVRDRVLLEAKRMLVQSFIPIGQIADELGFKDFSYFSRQFKKYLKLSPDQYRIKMQAQFG